MTTDLAVITNDLVIRDPDTGAPTAVRMPGTGDAVSFDDLAGLAAWKRVVMDLKYESLRPVEHLVDEAIYQHLDHAGVYSAHLDNGLDVTGESAATWQDATQVDGAGLYDDLLTLRQRDGLTRDEAVEWIAELCKVEITFTAKGQTQLKRMAGAYRDALVEHTKPLDRARKAPSVRRAK